MAFQGSTASRCGTWRDLRFDIRFVIWDSLQQHRKKIDTEIHGCFLFESDRTNGLITKGGVSISNISLISSYLQICCWNLPPCRHCQSRKPWKNIVFKANEVDPSETKGFNHLISQLPIRSVYPDNYAETAMDQPEKRSFVYIYIYIIYNILYILYIYHIYHIYMYIIYNI